MHEFNALGTHWWIEPLGGVELSSEVRDSIDHRVDAFSNHYSRFDSSSLLNKLNIERALHNPPKEMVAMLQFSKQMYYESEGVFNISVGGTLRRLGYGKVGSLAHDARDFWPKTHISSKTIVIPDGITLDFGGFGKGWLIDAIADILELSGVSFYCINGGGDIRVSSREGVTLYLEDPHDAGRSIGTVTIHRGALAASSVHKRSWQKDGRSHHHIIDPALNASSVSEVIASYVTASTALVADTLGTILIIRPTLERSLCKKYDAEALLIQRGLSKT